MSGKGSPADSRFNLGATLELGGFTSRSRIGLRDGLEGHAESASPSSRRRGHGSKDEGLCVIH